MAATAEQIERQRQFEEGEMWEESRNEKSKRLNMRDATRVALCVSGN